MHFQKNCQMAENAINLLKTNLNQTEQKGNSI
jgi:hypothetical protein